MSTMDLINKKVYLIERILFICYYIVNYNSQTYYFQNVDTNAEAENIPTSLEETHNKSAIVKKTEDKKEIKEENLEDKIEDKNNVDDGQGADEIMSVLQVNVDFVF